MSWECNLCHNECDLLSQEHSLSVELVGRERSDYDYFFVDTNTGPVRDVHVSRLFPDYQRKKYHYDNVPGISASAFLFGTNVKPFP